MGIILCDPYTIQCENYTHWVELVIRDEHNQPFPNIKGTLTDGSGATYDITVGDEPILLKKIAPGFVTLSLDNKSWINETQKRMPLLAGSESPVKTWLAQNPTGYQGAEREHHSVTIGDFIELTDEQSLPKHHQAGSLGKLDLVADTSNVVVIQGCRFITLRLGMFFDGTANNSYSAEWGKTQFDNQIRKWRSHYNVDKHILSTKLGFTPEMISTHELSENCFEKGDALNKTMSAASELTNVQKMFDLYKTEEFSENQDTYFYSQYVTGIGTGNELTIAPADEDGMGLGGGIGDFGVIEKVQTCIDALISNVKEILRNAEHSHKLPIDGIRKIEFDVFGFSRGAAAARHFINVLLDGPQGEFANAFTQACIDNQLSFASDFDWQSNDYCEVMFAGLFDTVAAIVQLNPMNDLDFDKSPHDKHHAPVRLWLNPSRVRRAVHFVANKKTEYRHNFSANLLNKAPHFDEIVVPGAHSDVGGGYHSKMSYAQKKDGVITYHDDYWLPRLSNQWVYEDSETYTFWGHDKAREKLIQRCHNFIQDDCKNGWDALDYFIDIKATLSGATTVLSANVYFRQLTEGDLSRLYLRMMFGLAKHADVPVEEMQREQIVWQSTEDYFYLYFPVPKHLAYKHKSAPPYPFDALCNKVLDSAKQGHVAQLRNIFGDTGTLKALISLGLIHHSADIKPVADMPFDLLQANRPHTKDGSYQREEYPCEQ